MAKRKMFWTVRLGVDQSWVADGFDLTRDRAKEMLAKSIPFAHNSELSARILERPGRKIIRKAQGY